MPRILASLALAISMLALTGPAKAELNSCTEITTLPFTIAVQGVYCLKQNLNVNLTAGGSAAITINAGNVTIDFNGFRVNNQAPATNQARGVYAADRKNVTLRNGFIRGFYVGVYLDENAVDASASHLVESMKTADSGLAGIWVEGDRSEVRDNRVLDTGGGGTNISAYGIIMQSTDDGLVADNIVSRVYETFENFGIIVYSSTRFEITGNKIKNVNGGSNVDIGIGLSNALRAHITDNRLLNTVNAATGGIIDIGFTSNQIICVNNRIDGFGANILGGCEVSEDNHSNYD